MKNISKENNTIICIACGKEILNNELVKCPNCNNTIGLSEDTLTITSVGSTLFKKRVSEDFFIFGFNFEFDSKENLTGIISHSEFIQSTKPFLGIKAHIHKTPVGPLVGAEAVAVFNGYQEVNVDIPDDFMKYVKSEITPFMVEHVMPEILKEYGLDSNDNNNVDIKDVFSSTTKSDDENDDTDDSGEDNYKEPSKEEMLDRAIEVLNKIFADMEVDNNENHNEEDCDDCDCDECYCDEDEDENFNLDNKTGVVSLEDIANAMYSLVKSKHFGVTELQWTELPLEIKEDMARELQYNTNYLVQLMNYATLGIAFACSNELKDDVKLIILNHFNDYILNQDVSYDLYELSEELDEMNVAYEFCDAVELSDFESEKDMISIYDLEGNEVLHVIKSKDKYQIFDTARVFKGYKIIDSENSNNTILTLEQLVSLISKMNVSRNELVKAITDEYIAEMLTDNKELEFNTTVDEMSTSDIDSIGINNEPEIDENTYENVREFMLRNIDKLTNEDLMNELNRRLISR